MLNRRSFLIQSSVVTATALTGISLALAETLPSHIIPYSDAAWEAHVRNHFKDIEPINDAIIDINLKIAKLVNCKFFTTNRHYMTTPLVQTRKYQTIYSMDLMQDIKDIQGIDTGEELIRIMSLELATEINRENKRIAPIQTIPYIYANLVRANDPSTYQPIIGFTSRLAHCEDPYKLTKGV